MPTPFPQTLRSLEADSSRAWALPGLLGAGMGLCLLWALLVPIPVQIGSLEARVDADAAPVQSLIDGRLARVMIALGQQVREGEVLVELAADEIWLELEESQARRDSAEARARMVAERGPMLTTALRERLAQAKQAREALQIQLPGAQDRAALAQDRAAASARLADAGSLAAAAAASDAEEAARAADHARVLQAEAGAAVRRAAEVEQLNDQEEARYREELSVAEGEFAALEVRVARLEEEIERYRLRAPLTGRVGFLGSSVPGAAIRAGEVLAMIVAEPPDRVLAVFPAAALGRLQPGQEAWMQLDALPWTQYGRLPLVVQAVGNPVGGEQVQVSLTLTLDQLGGVPLQTGMPGAVVVSIARQSVAARLLGLGAPDISPPDLSRDLSPEGAR